MDNDLLKLKAIKLSYNQQLDCLDSGDTHSLVCAFLNMVRKQVNRCQPVDKNERDNMMQGGIEGFLECLPRFDRKKGHHLSTFAYRYITNGVIKSRYNAKEHIRRIQKRPMINFRVLSYDSMEGYEPFEPDTAYDTEVERETWNLVSKELENLPGIQKEIVLMRLEKKAWVKIAADLNKSQYIVKKNYKLAMTVLNTNLKLKICL